MIYILDKHSRELCTINTPFGLYRYKRFPMGVSVSPHICQQHRTVELKDVLGKNVVVYFDDCGIWTDGSFEDHLLLVKKVLSKLIENGFKCNPLKCDWAVKETDFLGFWMTPNSVRPMKTKIDAILKMQRPQTTTQARSLIGAVNFYKSLFPRRAHVLAPLADLTGDKSFVWDDT